MPATMPLSELLEEVRQCLEERFDGLSYWVSARAMNVKRYPGSRRCYLTLEEYQTGNKTAEAKAVLWSNFYHELEQFEQATRQPLRDGTELVCRVRVRYHVLYGFNLDILQIDVAHTLGLLELERQAVLDQLVASHPDTIRLVDGVYHTLNRQLPIPPLVPRIALITAPGSDGQRDFLQELTTNKHGYHFQITQFLTTIQGENAHLLILEQLEVIRHRASDFDLVAIVRGGGALADFRPFDQYELASAVAHFPLPILTGIGHDRNQSITDLMARELKTPTKVAAWIVERHFEFDNRLLALRERFFTGVKKQLLEHTQQLAQLRRMIRLASPQAILDRGFAILQQDGRIITNPDLLEAGTALQARLKDQLIHTTIQKKTLYEPDDLQ